jgi:hypothetical protein
MVCRSEYHRVGRNFGKTTCSVFSLFSPALLSPALFGAKLAASTTSTQLGTAAQMRLGDDSERDDIYN